MLRLTLLCAAFAYCTSPLVGISSEPERPMISAITLSGDGSKCVLATTDGTITQLELPTKRTVWTTFIEGKAGSKAESIAFADKDRLVVSSEHLLLDKGGGPSGQPRIIFMDAATGKVARKYPNVDGTTLALGQGGKLVAASSGATINLFSSVSSFFDRRVLESKNNSITGLSISPDSGTIAAVGVDHLSTNDVNTGAALLDLEIAPQSLLRDVIFTSDGKRILVIGIRDGQIEYRFSATGVVERCVSWEKRYRQVRASADHTLFASCGHSGPGVKVWEVDSGRTCYLRGSQSL